MGKLIRRIRFFNFKGILVILLVFSLIASVLLVELSGIQTNRYRNTLELLPQEKALTKAQACQSLVQDTLFIYNSDESVSLSAYPELLLILGDMKVGHTVTDLCKDPLPDLQNFNKIIVALSDLSPMGQKLSELCDWVHGGGFAWFPLVLESNAYFDSIAQLLGINDLSPDYHKLSKIYPNAEFMIGGGTAFTIPDSFDSARTVVLSERAVPYAHADGPNGMPLVWKTPYGSGHFVVDNIGVYDKAFRGFYAASFSLLDEICVYPVINASVFYLDDFPSQIPGGDSEYIQRDYQTTIRDFYINIWWPDMMNIADRYGMKYTGLAIESYNDDTDGSTSATPDTGTFTNFGNMLLRKGGELGYHGYNHQPLCFDNIDYQGHYDYKTWQSEAAMKAAFDELIDLCKDLFPDAEFTLYVPPSNFLSAEGRDFLQKHYPHIKTISGIYFNDASDEGLEDAVCLQEFGMMEDGIVDQPRVISGFILDDFQKLAALSELNLHFINSHFTHPDDALDADRGAELGWEEMKRKFNDYLSWLYGSAPTLRNLTGTETSAAVQRFSAISPVTEITENQINITLGNFHDEAQLMIRFNEKAPDQVQGGQLTHLTGDLYLLQADAATVTITLK